jgi:putative ABC transport system permease protein
MTAAVRARPGGPAPVSGGSPARRAVVRWAWRMFRREWRQQLIVLGLLIVAVAASTVGIALANGAPTSPNAEFGTANHLLTITGSSSQVDAAVRAAARDIGAIEVIDHQKVKIPGSVNTTDLRSQAVDGNYSYPMLRLDAGSFPAGPGQVAVTAGVASIYRLRIGSVWHENGRALTVTGIVENPGNWQDQFALVAPGQISAPYEATVLFNAGRSQLRRFAPAANEQLQGRPPYNPGFPPVAVLVFDTIALTFVGLIAVAGFTVLAQRRLRALGMLGAVGATDRHIRLVVLANGAVVGVIAAVTGTAAGLAGWAAFVPHLETIVQHRIAAFSLPWWEIAAAMLLTALTAVAAAWWPARAASRLPIVAALSGRPPSPRQGRRFAAVGTAVLAVGLAFIALSRHGKVAPLVIVGLVATTAGILLLGPLAISRLATVAKGTPVAVRLALRDLGRYQARSGAALAAISLAVGIAAVIAVSAAAAAAAPGHTGAPAGWANLPANQVMVYVSPGGAVNLPEVAPAMSTGRLALLRDRVSALADLLHSSRVVTLDAVLAPGIQSAQEGQVTGKPAAALAKSVTGPDGRQGLQAVVPVYLATSAVLSFYAISPAQIKPATDIITSVPDLSGTKLMTFAFPAACAHAAGNGCVHPGKHAGPAGRNRPGVSNPVMQVLSQLPHYSSAPATLITAREVKALSLTPAAVAWLIQTPQPLTSAQVTRADHWAAAAGLTVETATRTAQASLVSVSNRATAAAVVAALVVLAMTIGLIRSETAGDLRVLAATGAGSRTRRLITGATAAALALLGALLGTIAAYLGVIAWNRGIHNLANAPVVSLVVLIGGLPIAALAAGWLLAGREPPAIARQPLD